MTVVVRPHRADPAPRFRGVGTYSDERLPAPLYARPGIILPVPHEQAMVTCWCESTFVSVSLDDIRVGLTGACRFLACQRIDDDRRGDAA